MTKKLSLEESKKLATPGELTADCMRVYTNDGEFWIASTDTPGPATDEEAMANAALLAHCWNRFDEVVAALEKAIKFAGMSDDDSRLDDFDQNKLMAVLERAKEVTIP